jgi:bacillithiol biosynthesis cysteine-adding enzyme BshC
VSGGEDHDFDEIATVKFFGKHFSWITNQTGAVGRMNLDGLEEAINNVVDVFGTSPFAFELKSIILECFQKSKIYSDFNFHLVNKLFAKHGLIVINMDHGDLKKKFLPYAIREIKEGISSVEVRKTQNLLEQEGIKEQAYVREINLFFIEGNSRSRITEESGLFTIGENKYNEQGLLNLLSKHPENISPNVVMRPIYQELILPNLAYVGGGGEIAYWLERKSQFEAYEIPYPMLIRRNSALIVSKSISNNLSKLGLTVGDSLYSLDELTKKYLKDQTEEEFNLNGEIKEMQSIFLNLSIKAKNVDPSLEKYTLAEGAKQLKVLNNISSKITKAAKEKNKIALNKIANLKEKLFPNGNLQERHDSFIPYYLKYGNAWFEELLETMDPMNKSFMIIEESN